MIVIVIDANPGPDPGRDPSDPGRERDEGELGAGNGGGAEVEREKGPKAPEGTELRRTSSRPLPVTGSDTSLRPL